MSSAKWRAFCLGLYVLKIHTRLALSPRMAGPPLSGKHSHRLHLSGQAIGKKYSAVPLSRGQFSPNFSQETPNSSPVRASDGVSFVSLKSDLATLVIMTGLHVIS